MKTANQIKEITHKLCDTVDRALPNEVKDLGGKIRTDTIMMSVQTTLKIIVKEKLTPEEIEIVLNTMELIKPSH